MFFSRTISLRKLMGSPWKSLLPSKDVMSYCSLEGSWCFWKEFISIWNFHLISLKRHRQPFQFKLLVSQGMWIRYLQGCIGKKQEINFQHVFLPYIQFGQTQQNLTFLSSPDFLSYNTLQETSIHDSNLC